MWFDLSLHILQWVKFGLSLIKMLIVCLKDTKSSVPIFSIYPADFSVKIYFDLRSFTTWDSYFLYWFFNFQKFLSMCNEGSEPIWLIFKQISYIWELQFFKILTFCVNTREGDILGGLFTESVLLLEFWPQKRHEPLQRFPYCCKRQFVWLCSNYLGSVPYFIPENKTG